MTVEELTMDEFYTRRINELAVALKAEHLARLEAERKLAERDAQDAPDETSVRSRSGTTLDALDEPSE